MMKESRMRVLLSAQTVIAQKVYGAIPIQEEWDIKAICTELVRSGFQHDKRIINGCVNSLIASGLVIEKSRGKYQRIPVKPEKENVPTTTETTKPLTPKNTSPEKAPAIDRVCEISSHFIKLAASMKSLADDLETAAIELADQQQRSEDDVAKLKQLQQLLKSIGG